MDLECCRLGKFKPDDVPFSQPRNKNNILPDVSRNHQTVYLYSDIRQGLSAPASRREALDAILTLMHGGRCDRRNILGVVEEC